MPNQFNAADLVNVPRVYYDSGEQNVGTSGVNAGFTSFQAGTLEDETNFNNVSESVYPNTNGSYNSNDGDNNPSGVNFATHVGWGVDQIRWVGYYDWRPLASGENNANITHTVFADPSGINGGLLDPWLQSGV